MPNGCSSPFHRHPISIMVSTISAQRLSSPRSSLVAVIPIFTNHTMHSPASALSSCGDGHRNHDEQTTISRSFPLYPLSTILANVDPMWFGHGVTSFSLTSGLISSPCPYPLSLHHPFTIPAKLAAVCSWWFPTSISAK